MSETNIVTDVLDVFRAAGFEVREDNDRFAIVGSIDSAGILMESVREHFGSSTEAAFSCAQREKESEKFIAAQAPVQNAEEVRRAALDPDQLYRAVIDCGHSICDDRIILYRDSDIEGNALSQLSDRLANLASKEAAAAEAPSQLTPNWAGEFSTFQDWVNRAQRVLSVPSHHAPAICVDAKGRRCFIGADMRRASEEGAFPVRYFWNCEPTQQSAQGEKGGDGD